MASGDKVRVEVLGQIQVVSDGAVVAVSPQLRRLIGLLVAAGGETVSSARLAEYVADGMADSTVRTAVSRLRKVVGDRLESGDGGYRLVLGNGELDASIFDGMVERARPASMPDRVEALAGAVALWRGPAFGDHGDEEWASAVASRLNLAHAAAVEDLAEALVDVGRHQEAVELLEPHIGDHPYRERPVALLMCAFDALGRRADAVRAFQRFRTVLRDDTGLEPSAELRALESDLLADDDEPDVSTGNDLPTGTVTFLFTDIEGSTERWADDEESMAGALAAHDEVLRASVESHGGVVFKHTGDGVCAAFASAPGAVGAAIDAQDDLELPVRMGLHTGEAELRDGDYFGPTLNRVARIMDAGHGGQILMSSATAGLIRDAVVTTDLGRHRLKGLSTSERIVQVGAGEFSPLRVGTASAGNLPADAYEFVGRDEELGDLADRLLDHRMVTLLGVGGTGKTRLALETAAAIAPTFPDGCWFVELAPISTPAAVPFAIAAGLGIQPPEGGDVLDHVIGRIKHQRRLVILDNCEHVVGAAADAVELLMTECPTVTILATSREALMIRGEQLVPISSLSVDDAEAMFRSRAHDEAPGSLRDERQLEAVRHLCDRLDRLPLAIELAASRLRVMTPIEMLAGLDERFRLLTGGRRSRMERHQTMRATVDWSYELCDAVERMVFDRLSVFMTAFDLDAAVVVAGDEQVGRLDVTDALERLVERSMAQRTTAHDGTSRFSMLETMRAYGREHLAEQGVADEVRRRHARHATATIAALSLRSFGPDEEAVLAETRRLVPELLPALEWCIEYRAWTQAVRLTAIQGAVPERIVTAVSGRLAEAIVDAEGDLDVLGPHERLHLQVCLHGEIISGDVCATEDFVQNQRSLIRGDVPVVTDCLLVPPETGGLYYMTTETPTPDSFGHLDGTPVVQRYLARFWTVDGLIQKEIGYGDAGTTVPGWLHDELRDLVDTLDSARARRWVLGQHSLVAQMAGDYPTMLRCAEAALPDDDRADEAAIDAACRYLRALAFLRRSPTGAELRRPWTWILDGGFFTPLLNALHTTAGTAHVAERPELSDRLLAKLRYEGGEDHWSWFEDNVSRATDPADADFVERVRRAVPSDEDIEDLVADVFRLADELDRRRSAGDA